MKKPSRYSYYVKALKFYKNAKKQFTKYSEYTGLCAVLAHGSDDLHLTDRQRSSLSASIWRGVDRIDRSAMYFPNNKERVKYINEMIKHFSAKVDKK